jgi:hypothetical protein
VEDHPVRAEFIAHHRGAAGLAKAILGIFNFAKFVWKATD